MWHCFSACPLGATFRGFICRGRTSSPVFLFRREPSGQRKGMSCTVTKYDIYLLSRSRASASGSTAAGSARASLQSALHFRTALRLSASARPLGATSALTFCFTHSSLAVFTSSCWATGHGSNLTQYFLFTRGRSKPKAGIAKPKVGIAKRLNPDQASLFNLVRQASRNHEIQFAAFHRMSPKAFDFASAMLTFGFAMLTFGFTQHRKQRQAC